MQKQIGELTELFHKCDKVSMLVMTPSGFEQLFGKIYAAVNCFLEQLPADGVSLLLTSHKPKLDLESEQLVDIACNLLERALTHHSNKNTCATENAAIVFEEIVQRLLKILKYAVRVDEKSYQEARTTRLRLHALKAFGISLPNHSISAPTRWGPNDHENESQATEALHYVRENLTEFIKFVYGLGLSNESIQDPFMNSLSSKLRLYERVKALEANGKQIESAKSLSDA